MIKTEGVPGCLVSRAENTRSAWPLTSSNEGATPTIVQRATNTSVSAARAAQERGWAAKATGGCDLEDVRVLQLKGT